MKMSFLTLGAVGVLAAGVAIHHSGHCPLMDAKKALTHHSAPAPASGASAVSEVSAASGAPVALVAKASAGPAAAIKPDAVAGR